MTARVEVHQLAGADARKFVRPYDTATRLFSVHPKRSTCVARVLHPPSVHRPGPPDRGLPEPGRNGVRHCVHLARPLLARLLIEQTARPGAQVLKPDADQPQRRATSVKTLEQADRRAPELGRPIGGLGHDAGS